MMRRILVHTIGATPLATGVQGTALEQWFTKDLFFLPSGKFDVMAHFTTCSLLLHGALVNGERKGKPRAVTTWHVIPSSKAKKMFVLCNSFGTTLYNELEYS
jgi:hypothetical protein